MHLKPLQKREEILARIADAIDSRQEEILRENEADVKTAQETKIDENLMQRLGMKPQKLKNLTAGIRAIANQSEPIRKVGVYLLHLCCSKAILQHKLMRDVITLTIARRC